MRELRRKSAGSRSAVVRPSHKVAATRRLLYCRKIPLGLSHHVLYASDRQPVAAASRQLS